MPSPFPGMNPYLEQNDTWEDFHQSLITHARDVLAPCVGDNYLVKVEVRLYLHELSAEERRYFGRADLGVTAVPTRPSTTTGVAAASAAPLRLTLPAVEIERRSSLEIRDRRSRRLVTVLELLSPSNKGPDYYDYLGKRSSILAGDTNLVEVDLRRGGERPRPPDLPPCDYYVLVSRAAERPAIDVWPMGLRDRLPRVPIPLWPPDADVPLDLQALLDRVYDAADYGKYIYNESPVPPLSSADAEWANQCIPEGFRT